MSYLINHTTFWSKYTDDVENQKMCVKFSRTCSRTQNCPSVYMDEIHHVPTEPHQDFTAACVSMWSACKCHWTRLGRVGWFDLLGFSGGWVFKLQGCFRSSVVLFVFFPGGGEEGMVGRHRGIQSCLLYNYNILPLAKFISRHFGSIFERYSSFSLSQNSLRLLCKFTRTINQGCFNTIKVT